MSGQWWRYPSGTVRQRMIPGYEDLVASVVVLDPEDYEQVERFVRIYSGQPNGPFTADIADDIQNALREFANPEPPKPAEPTGLGAVVEDAEGVWLVRLKGGHWADGESFPRPWSRVTAVRVLSEGVSA